MNSIQYNMKREQGVNIDACWTAQGIFRPHARKRKALTPRINNKMKDSGEEKKNGHIYVISIFPSSFTGHIAQRFARYTYTNIPIMLFRVLLCVLCILYVSAVSRDTFIELTSKEFFPTTNIPLPMACAALGGEVISPELTWQYPNNGGPKGSDGGSYILVMFDEGTINTLGFAYLHWYPTRYSKTHKFRILPRQTSITHFLTIVFTGWWPTSLST